MIALARHNSCRSAASVQFECAVCDGLLHNGVLRRELFEECSPESVELLQTAGGVSDRATNQALEAQYFDSSFQRRPLSLR
jgi:hypothetical protein